MQKRQRNQSHQTAIRTPEEPGDNRRIHHKERCKGSERMNVIKKCKTCKRDFTRENKNQVTCLDCIAKRKPKMSRGEYLLQLATQKEARQKYLAKRRAQKPANYFTCEKCGSTDMKSDGDARYCRKCFWHPRIYAGRPKIVANQFLKKDYPCMDCGIIIQAKTKRCLCPECGTKRQRISKKKSRRN